MSKPSNSLKGVHVDLVPHHTIHPRRVPQKVRTIVHLTNLAKPFWPELKLTKCDLLQYYADIAPVLLPHLAARAFFMKRTPDPHPDWLQTCSIRHASASMIAFPVIDDLAALLWVVNLGCIDLNQWYARCEDVNRPDYLHYDLDP
jgi:bifunctional non-homologous end joining protein LigD